MDTLIVRGLRGFNGEYPVDLIALTNIGTGGESLDNREQHRLKKIAEVRGAEILDAFLALDAATMVGLAAIILSRHGKEISVDILWDARFLYVDVDSVPDDDEAGPTIIFAVMDRAKMEADAEVTDDPPAEAPPSHSTIGGASSSQTSDLSVNGLSLTGRLNSVTPAISDPATLAS